MKYFKLPVDSYNEAEALLAPLFCPSGFIGPVSGRTVAAGLAYLPLHGDPDDPVQGYRQEAWACAYLSGDFSDNPDYTAPDGVVEITWEEYLSVQPQGE